MNNRKKAFWGTGIWAKVFVYMDDIAFDFFLDNDRSKIGVYEYNKPVIHPTQVEDWSDIFVYIPHAYYVSVKKQLMEIGLAEHEDFEEWNPDFTTIGIKLEYLKKDFEETIEMLKAQAERIDKKRRTIVFGDNRRLLMDYIITIFWRLSKIMMDIR